MTTKTNKHKPKIICTNPTTIDQRAVKASENVFGSYPLPEKQNIKRPLKKRK